MHPHIDKANLVCSKMKFGYTDENINLSIDNLEIKEEKSRNFRVIGSGKSTLLRILAGIYATQEGRVTFDGIDMTKISKGFFIKRDRLFNSITKTCEWNTKRDNLSYGIVQSSDEDIIEAAKNFNYRFNKLFTKWIRYSCS